MFMFGSQAGAECGKLCNSDWWFTATEADVQAELDAGANSMAQDEKGATIKLKNISREKEKRVRSMRNLS
jgi:hypothetical protein